MRGIGSSRSSVETTDREAVRIEIGRCEEVAIGGRRIDGGRTTEEIALATCGCVVLEGDGRSPNVLFASK